MSKLQRIGVLTGGGDCPGLNAVIRAVTKTAIHDYGLEVFGIEDGYEGLITKRGRFLTSEDVSGILTHGGTILGTSNKADPFRVPVAYRGKVHYEDQSSQVCRHLKEWGIDALAAVGGDGTLTIAHQLASKGVRVVGIPKTIDNDLVGTDFTFGFDTAVQIASEALDRLHTTAASHHRVMILEVMGRNAGWIALHAGVSAGADIILIPEIPFHCEAVCAEVRKRAGRGKRFSLLTVAEGAHEAGAGQVVKKMDPSNPYPVKLGGIGRYLEEKIQKMTKLETRAAVLGHIQRGGSPSPFDRNLGTMFGVHAVELLAQCRWNRMVRLSGHTISSIPIKDVAGQIRKVPLNYPLLKSAKAVGTSFGI